MEKMTEFSPDDLEDMIDSFFELEVFIFKSAEKNNLDFQTIYTNLIGVLYKLSVSQGWDIDKTTMMAEMALREFYVSIRKWEEMQTKKGTCSW